MIRSPRRSASRGFRSTRFRPRIATPAISRRLWLYIFGSFASMIGLLHLTDVKVVPLISSTARTVAIRAATEALHAAITEELAQDVDYERIVHVERGKSGTVQLAHFDFASVTRLQSEATEQADAALQSLSEETLRVPFSQVFGGSILSSIGPSLPIRLRLIGAARSSVTAEVSSAGINQTVHVLYLDLTAEMSVVAPLISSPISVESRVPIAYIVLAGEVPDTYMGGYGGLRGTLPSKQDHGGS